MPSVAPSATTSEIDRRSPASERPTIFWLALAVAWVFSAVWIWHFLLRQWVPHDEGTFADIADRILRGEIPHRDFLDLYTGGLGYLHAVGWKLFGRDLAVFRYTLYLFALVWLPALYYIATRFVRPVVAAAVVAAAVTWSLPNYPAAVPSWYNLFFATWGTAALLRYSEKTRYRWVFIAGICGGLSFLSKVSGLFFVLAAAAFLVYRSQQQPADKHDRTGVLLRCATVVAVVLVVVKVVAGWLTPGTLAYFILPALFVAGALLRHEWQCLRASTGGSAGDLLMEGAILAAGVVVPLVPFLLIYRHGGLAQWVDEVFILPKLRLQFAHAEPPPLNAIAVAAGVWMVCGMIVTSRKRGVRAIASGALLAAFVLATSQDAAFRSIWYSLAGAIPVATLVGSVIVFRKDERVFLLVAVTALCSLVQFPFAVPIYFCYIAPLVAILLAALIATRSHISRAGVAVVLAFYIVAGIALVDPGSIYSLGDHYERTSFDGRLNAPGARRLRVLPEQADLYNALIPVVQEHARGEYVYASPSAPEVYFLSGHRNPTYWTFDFFDHHSTDVAFVSAMLSRHQINVVVVNTQPDFDPPPSAEMMAMYQQLFPQSQRFDRFEVRWRE